MKRFFESSAFLFLFGLIVFGSHANAQPTPKSVLGFVPTDDKTVADWAQITNYFAKLDAASPKVLVKEIGKTTLGKPMIVAFISSPANIRDLERYRQMNAKLADPRTIKDNAELNNILANGKSIVSISCSIHSTEIVASQMSMNLAYELATATDAETKEILDNTILLLIPSSNPDGVQIVADWYKKTLGTKSEGTSPPELYHHYAGHDNNRDWFMLNLQETRSITKLFWQEWFPEIVYDVHQQGVVASRFTIPPFYDPPNPRISPSILREVGLVGYKMAADLQATGIAGVASNSAYDTWWHGGFRSAPYYHNSIGILTEAASANLMSPATVTPEQLKRSRGSRGLPSLVEPATNFPDPWKGGVWGPRNIAEIEMISSRSILSLASKYRQRYLKNFHSLGNANLKADGTVPQAYVIMAGQPNNEAVARFIEILTFQGIEVQRMTNELWVKHSKTEDFHEIPLNSYLVFTNQPQKNNVLSLFEKQVYPHRVDANGQPDTPYDVAGWTLPMQMGVENYEVWDIRDLEKFRPTLEKVTNQDQVRKSLNMPASPLGFAKHPNPLKTAPRIGMYKSFTSSMDEGWTRLVFDNHQIPFKSISNEDFRQGRLDYDVIVLPADSENSILNGNNAERYPAEFAGGIGDSGVENLRKFVENGGKLVCLDDSCELAIKKFGLPMKNVLNGVARKDFYNPGSIVKIKVDRSNPIGRNVLEEIPGYFINSSAFDLSEPPASAGGQSVVKSSDVSIIARYAEKDALLSGWMLGEKLINGKIALAEATYGKGKIVLFAFRPQHRGQTYATFPLLFNALEK
ncbi:MAG TPA: M14 family metallopeptidase [Pyrinomonadaceae bacterium]|nr:M14 family metallopeptidase [Pyrinomonadaceae bacterium]